MRFWLIKFLKAYEKLFIDRINIVCSFYSRTVLKTPDGRDMWVLPDQRTGFYDIELKLPDGIKCKQCILQVNIYLVNIFNGLVKSRNLSQLVSIYFEIIIISGPITPQTVGVKIPMERRAWVVDNKKHLGRVQI